MNTLNTVWRCTHASGNRPTDYNEIGIHLNWCNWVVQIAFIFHFSSLDSFKYLRFVSWVWRLHIEPIIIIWYRRLNTLPITICYNGSYYTDSGTEVLGLLLFTVSCSCHKQQNTMGTKFFFYLFQIRYQQHDSDLFFKIVSIIST